MYHQLLAGVTQVVVGGMSSVHVMMGSTIQGIDNDLDSDASIPGIRLILWKPASAPAPRWPGHHGLCHQWGSYHPCGPSTSYAELTYHTRAVGYRPDMARPSFVPWKRTREDRLRSHHVSGTVSIPSSPVNHRADEHFFSGENVRLASTYPDHLPDYMIDSPRRPRCRVGMRVGI